MMFTWDKNDIIKSRRRTKILEKHKDRKEESYTHVKHKLGKNLNCELMHIEL